MFPVPIPTITKTKVYEIDVTANENGETSITFPDELGLLQYWKAGQKTYWIDHGNGNWSIYVNNGEEDATEVSTD